MCGIKLSACEKTSPPYDLIKGGNPLVPGLRACETAPSESVGTLEESVDTFFERLEHFGPVVNQIGLTVEHRGIVECDFRQSHSRGVGVCTEPEAVDIGIYLLRHGTVERLFALLHRNHECVRVGNFDQYLVFFLLGHLMQGVGLYFFHQIGDTYVDFPH